MYGTALTVGRSDGNVTAGSGMNLRPRGQHACDLVYRALVARFANGGESYSYRDDVLVPLLGAVLKAQNEYGWAANSCAPGSLNFVLAVLEGRMEIEESSANPKKAVAKKEVVGEESGGPVVQLPKLREYLEEFRVENDVFTVRAEALTRVAEYSDYATASGVEVESRLSRALELVAEGGELSVSVAKNEVRGIFFQLLSEEYDQAIARQFRESVMNNGGIPLIGGRAAVHQRGIAPRRKAAATYDRHRTELPVFEDPEVISRELSQVLDNMVAVADAFAWSFLVVVADIPTVFGQALACCGAQARLEAAKKCESDSDNEGVASTTTGRTGSMSTSSGSRSKSTTSSSPARSGKEMERVGVASP